MRICRKVFLLALLLSLLAGAHGQAQAADLVVSAAASLTEAFQAVKAAYEKTHPDTKIITNFGASGALLAQIEQGAPADVLASADQKTMDQAAAKGLLVAGSRQDFVRNALVLAAPAGAKTLLKGLADLTPTQRIAMGNPETVPAGRYTQEALQTAGRWEPLQPALIYGENVKQVLDYVVRGEVDAGFVFATDAKAAGDKVRVVSELTGHAPIRYPVAVVAASKQAQAAASFVAFVTGAEGQAILARYGFAAP